mgnify:CR=1 FL=1
MKYNFEIINSQDELSKVFEFLQSIFEDLNADADISMKVDLFFEELITNIIKYGYDDSLEHKINLEVNSIDNSIYCTIIDDGHFFNPLDAPEPDVTVDAEDREIGGLGILLIKSLANHCEYKRENNQNIFTAQFDF